MPSIVSPVFREREADTREYALTIRDTDDQRGGTVKHYKIKRFDNNEGFYITTRRTFATLRDLVDYYTGGQKSFFEAGGYRTDAGQFDCAFG